MIQERFNERLTRRGSVVIHRHTDDIVVHRDGEVMEEVVEPPVVQMVLPHRHRHSRNHAYLGFGHSSLAEICILDRIVIQLVPVCVCVYV